jgi:hypothetical protein
MTKLHERTFRQGSDDVERDEFLAVRCAALQFVRPEHLEIPAGVVDSDHLGRAVEELNKINKYKVSWMGALRRGMAGEGVAQGHLLLLTVWAEQLRISITHTGSSMSGWGHIDRAACVGKGSLGKVVSGSRGAEHHQQVQGLLVIWGGGGVFNSAGIARNSENLQHTVKPHHTLLGSLV